jgi:hypothetical protein
MALEPLDTAEGAHYNGCMQLSIFLENRVGQLLRLTRLFDGEPIHILGLSVANAVDCAIVRMMVDDPDAAYRLLIDHGFPISPTDVVVVALPPGPRGIMTISRALITSEVNINYLYPLIASHHVPASLAIQVDNITQAATALTKCKFRVIDHDELAG